MENQSPAGHTPRSAPNVRRFRCYTQTEKPKPPCSHCTTDHVVCEECLAADLIPNAVAIQYVEDFRVHVGRCIRHGKLVTACPKSPAIWSGLSVIHIQGVRYIASNRVSKLLAGAVCIGIFVGMLIAMAAIPLLLRSFS